jgi:hypothetical protein
VFRLIKFQQVNGGDGFSLPPAFDMKAFKAEILKEMRSEITKAKNEIIDGECWIAVRKKVYHIIRMTSRFFYLTQTMIQQK